MNVKKTTLISLLLLLFGQVASAQTYEDYIGNGHSAGITVTSSDESNNDAGANSINGTELIPDYLGAARFLAQSTLGYDEEDIIEVTEQGIEAWIDAQIDLPHVSYLESYLEVHEKIMDIISAVHGVEETDTRKIDRRFPFAFYNKAFNEPDKYRQKAAFALSQIFVISIQFGSFNALGDCVSSYYDILYDGAFGNFRDILEEITFHPAMGFYLSHYQNPKADPSIGTLPDENYAREIMQLFTIGLFELNNDGSQKLDSNGNPIPTYDISDIQELAKVFTGLSAVYEDGSLGSFNHGPSNYDLTQPMAIYENYHETSEKILLDGTVIPANQDGVDDIEMILDALFNHSNTGPFFALRLIQQLVKSSPSPAYIDRVASVFNDNGAVVFVVI